ncbi:MAG: Lpg1974 family pore-forming outer membrane protein [Pseudomonadota bacterium]
MVGLLSVPASAVAQTSGQTPSNAQLFQMIQQLKANQVRLEDEARAARREAVAAKRELKALKSRQRSAALATASPTVPTDGWSADARQMTGVTAGVGSLSGIDAGASVLGAAATGPAAQVHASEPRAFGSVTVKFVESNTDGNDFAVVNTTDSLFNDEGNDGPLLSLGDEDKQGAFEVEAGVRTGSGLEILGRYAHFNLDETQTATTNGNFTIQPTQTHVESDIDDDELDSNGDFARGRLERSVKVGDVELAKRVGLGRDFDLRFGAGLRVAQIDNKLTAEYVEPDDDSARTIQNNEISGVGGRFSFAANWAITHGVGLMASGGASILGAERSYKITQVDDIFDTQNADDGYLNFQSEETFVLTGVDAKLAITYDDQIGGVPVAVMAGYTFESWFNAVKDVRSVDDVDPNAMAVAERDVSSFGPFFKIGVGLNSTQPQ